MQYLSFFEYLALILNNMKEIKYFKRSGEEGILKDSSPYLAKNKKSVEKYFLSCEWKRKEFKNTTEPEVKNIIGACNFLKGQL